MQEGKRCSWRWLWNVQIFYRYFTARAKPFATRLTTTRFLSRKNCSPRLENMNLDAITANVVPVFKFAGSGLKSKLMPSLLSFLGLFRKRPTFTVGPWDMYKGQEYQHGRFYNSTYNFSWEIKIQKVCRSSISKLNSQESESKKVSDNGTNRTHTPHIMSHGSLGFQKVSDRGGTIINRHDHQFFPAGSIIINRGHCVQDLKGL